MDYFADSCIVINFLEFKNSDEEIKKRCYNYINAHKSDIFICTYVSEEIKNYLRKKEIMQNEVIQKKKNHEYIMGTNREAEILNKKEIFFVEDLYKEMENVPVLDCEKEFEEEIRILRLNFGIFLKKIKELISQQFDTNLANLLRETIEDYADCKVLSIALQIQQNKEIFTFVTADRHFLPNAFDYLTKEPRLASYKFPKFKNLLFEKD